MFRNDINYMELSPFHLFVVNKIAVCAFKYERNMRTREEIYLYLIVRRLRFFIYQRPLALTWNNYNSSIIIYSFFVIIIITPLAPLEPYIDEAAPFKISTLFTSIGGKAFNSDMLASLPSIIIIA